MLHDNGVLDAILFIAVLVPSVILHEVAHAGPGIYGTTGGGARLIEHDFEEYSATSTSTSTAPSG